MKSLELNDGSRDLAQTLVGQSDDSHVVDGVVGAQEVLDLNGIKVLAAGNDDVLLTVYKEDEAVLVLHGHVSGIEPAALVLGLCGLWEIPWN